MKKGKKEKKLGVFFFLFLSLLMVKKEMRKSHKDRKREIYTHAYIHNRIRMFSDIPLLFVELKKNNMIN